MSVQIKSIVCSNLKVFRCLSTIYYLADISRCSIFKGRAAKSAANLAEEMCVGVCFQEIQSKFICLYSNL